MAGFSKIYCIGGLGGFQGADGINPIELQILVGDADRQWLEPHYFDKSIRPLGSVNAIVPEGPDDPNALLDACLAFYPRHFRKCPLVEQVAPLLIDIDRLDFHFGRKQIPSQWDVLRREARPFFEQLNIWEAKLTRVASRRVIGVVDP
jgi:hypothetical protein